MPVNPAACALFRPRARFSQRTNLACDSWAGGDVPNKDLEDVRERFEPEPTVMVSSCAPSAMS